MVAVGQKCTQTHSENVDKMNNFEHASTNSYALQDHKASSSLSMGHLTTTVDGL